MYRPQQIKSLEWVTPTGQEQW